jgi:predicted transcriptional regulator
VDDGVQAISATDVKKRRKALGWAQHVLAAEAGVAFMTVVRIEQGNKARPETLQKIIEALDRGSQKAMLTTELAKLR